MSNSLNKIIAGTFVVIHLSLFSDSPAAAEGLTETQYILNTFSFLVHGFLVMFMAAGFAMLESGLVRSKNTATICHPPVDHRFSRNSSDRNRDKN